ncbi:ISL3 family transposase, partial [Nonomuraea endophytica]|uniref:ISL3 family transposase n=1 Tax=Nonomuraea endophytica TaxID=714136 RepID=UPI0037CA4BC0
MKRPQKEPIVPLELSADQARLLAVLFPQLNGLRLEQIEDVGNGLRILARTGTGLVACHRCGTASSRVHDRYRRRLDDLACGGRPVMIELEVRRFRCDAPCCPVATFAEQVPGLSERHQRRTPRLRGMLERVALALAGRAGARLATVLGTMVSRCTLLRLVRALPDPPVGQILVLGVDDFAKRKGHSYASLLVDLDTHRLVDLLPDREADTFADWLRAHPGAQIVCRDRAGAFAAGARQGAPEAIQVADRFHLWQSLGEAVEKTVIAYRADLHDPAPEPDPLPDPVDQEPGEPDLSCTQAVDQSTEGVAKEMPDGFRDVLGRERRLVIRHTERYEAVQALLAEGCSLAEIGRRLQLSRDAVRRFARATSLEEVLFKATHRASILDPFKPYLNQRWNDGDTNATALHTELQAQGWTGDVQAVRRYLNQFRPANGRARATNNSPGRPAAPTAPAPPKPRRVVRWLMTRPDHLSSADATHLQRILERSPGLAATAQHVRAFAQMMTELQGHHLDAWIAAIRADPLPALHVFANGLQRDHDAVRNGL